MKSCPTCNRTYPDDMLAFCLMDGSVLSAPYDPSDPERRPKPRGSQAPPTEVLNPRTTEANANSPLQSTIHAPAPQVPPLYSNRETDYPQNRQNRAPRRLSWIILAILLILWLLGFIGHIGGGLIHILLIIGVIVLIYNLIAGRR